LIFGTPKLDQMPRKSSIVGSTSVATSQQFVV